VKGVALNIVIYASIALASVAIFIMILNSIVPDFTGRSLCKLYRVVLNLPLPKQFKPEVPGCSFLPLMERVFLDEKVSTPESISNYIDMCWEKSDDGKTGLEFICYEVFMKKVKIPFNEDDITSSLKKNNKIRWLVGTVEGEEQTIIIKYNSTASQIEVI